MSRCLHYDHKGRRCLKSWHLLGAHQYAFVNKIGAKRARENVALALFRDEVRQRAHGMCEARWMVRHEGGFVCGAAAHDGDDPHHLWPEDRDRGTHDPDRALWLCRQAHDFAHQHPGEARVLGLLRPEVTT